ncbi:MAG: metallophosphoesterase [Polyangiaceae bacterium]
MRTLPLYALLSLLGHAFLYRYLCRAFPHASRSRQKWACIALGVATPLFRASLFVGLPTNAIASLFVVESLVVFIGGFLAIPLLAVFAREKARNDELAHEEDAEDEAAQDSTYPEDAPSSVDSRDTMQAPPSAHARPPLSRREVVVRTIGAFTYGTAASALGWGYLRARHDYRIEELVVRVEGLSKKLDGYTIVQVSDIHAGDFVGERELRDGFGRIAALKPDLVVATGDLVDHDARHAPMVARMLADLKARDGVYGILGNHDHYATGAKVSAELNRAGVHMLVNESTVLRANEGGILLVGVDDLVGSHFGGEGPRLRASYTGQPQDIPRILLAHQPTYIEWSRGFAALQLSGHTHGGQINPGFNAVALVSPYVAGRYQVGKTTLYVNRGFGVVGPPARLNAPPEITKVILVSA